MEKDFIDLKDVLAHRLYTALNSNGLVPTGERFSAHAMSACVRSFLEANTSLHRSTQYRSLMTSMGQYTRTIEKHIVEPVTRHVLLDRPTKGRKTRDSLPQTNGKDPKLMRSTM